VKELKVDIKALTEDSIKKKSPAKRGLKSFTDY